MLKSKKGVIYVKVFLHTSHQLLIAHPLHFRPYCVSFVQPNEYLSLRDHDGFSWIFFICLIYTYSKFNEGSTLSMDTLYYTRFGLYYIIRQDNCMQYSFKIQQKNFGKNSLKKNKRIKGFFGGVIFATIGLLHLSEYSAHFLRSWIVREK